jgi:suppressor of G2 allele of SKP1
MESAAAAAAAAAASRKRLAHYTHSHYQTDKVLYVEIQVAGLSAGEVTSSFAEDKVYVHIDRASPAETFTYQITPFAAIRAAKCTCTIKPDRVVLKIFKKEAAQWEVIFRKKEASSSSSSTSGSGDALPKAYATQRDWEEIDRNLTKELEAEKPKDEAALNKLFEDIYAKADPDTRRAMVKSMQTSGGTVLSTNWNEVKVRGAQNKQNCCTRRTRRAVGVE